MPTLKPLHAVMRRCTRCDLFLSRTQVVTGAGSADASALLVGEAPGATEDMTGMPFVGRSGELLTRMLMLAGISREDVFVANVVRCRPPKNRNPRAAEIRACAGWLREQIRLIEPLVVVTLGRFALHHFLPDRQISQIQGEVLRIPYHGRERTLYPLLHPAAILRNRARVPEYEAQFLRLGRLLEVNA